jgi:hypothetical protein
MNKRIINNKKNELNERDISLAVQEKRELDKELKNLDVEPLSVAKFFYEKGVEDIAIIQRLIYLVYCEILEKENLILFKEE